MNEAVDSGKIVGVKRFAVAKNDSVKSLSDKSYKALYALFRDVIDEFKRSGRLPESRFSWKRKPYLRRELESLCKVSVDMKPGEVARRIRATYFSGKPGPYLERYGHTFAYNPERRS